MVVFFPPFALIRSKGASSEARRGQGKGKGEGKAKLSELFRQQEAARARAPRDRGQASERSEARGGRGGGETNKRALERMSETKWPGCGPMEERRGEVAARPRREGLKDEAFWLGLGPRGSGEGGGGGGGRGLISRFVEHYREEHGEVWAIKAEY